MLCKLPVASCQMLVAVAVAVLQHEEEGREEFGGGMIFRLLRSSYQRTGYC